MTLFFAPKERPILAKPGRAWILGLGLSSEGTFVLATQNSNAPSELGIHSANQALPGLAKIGRSFGAKKGSIPFSLIDVALGLIQA